MFTEGTRLREKVTVGVHDKPKPPDPRKDVLAEALRRMEMEARPVRVKAQHPTTIIPPDIVAALEAYDKCTGIVMGLIERLK